MTKVQLKFSFLNKLITLFPKIDRISIAIYSSWKLSLIVFVLMSAFKNKNSLRTIEADSDFLKS